MRHGVKMMVMIVSAAAMVLSSCQTEKFTAQNPMPGSWYADNVDYEGVPTDFKVDIQPSFIEGEGLYVAEGQSVGRLEVTAGGEFVKAADIRYCAYNSITRTGKFVLHYDHYKDPEYVFSLYFYYDSKKDRFTVIEINYNITFCRRK